MSTITPLPTPPSRQDPANFSDRADEFLSALPTFGAELNVVAGEVNANATTASTNAGIATTAAIEATTARNEAVTLTESYQGSLSADPVLDKNGNPLSAGDWYIHSSTGSVRAYTGSDWVQGISSAAGVASVNGNNGVLTSKDVVPTLTANAGRVLKVNSGETDVEWGIGVASGYQEFTSSGTWTKPAEATWVYVEAIGGGGSGSAGFNPSTTRVYIGFGGGGGGFNARLIRAEEISSPVTVTVGAGGAGVTRISEGLAVGGNGGDSGFGPHITARGGQGGGVLANTPGAGGGGEIYLTDHGGMSGYTSGAGCQGVEQKLPGNSIKGGAGGGGSSTSVNLGGTSLEGGDGGAGVQANGASATAGDGEAPGGGGGGAHIRTGTTSTTVTSGAGGNGRVRVWWW